MGYTDVEFSYHGTAMKWRWLEYTDVERPRAGLNFQIPDKAEQLFLIATECVLRNGRRLRFWKDKWFDGQSISQIAPNLIPFVKFAQ